MPTVKKLRHYSSLALPSCAALPPVFVPTNVHHNIPAVLPVLAEDTLPENVILPTGDPPQAFPGESKTRCYVGSVYHKWETTDCHYK